MKVVFNERTERLARVGIFEKEADEFLQKVIKVVCFVFPSFNQGLIQRSIKGGMGVDIVSAIWTSTDQTVESRDLGRRVSKAAFIEPVEKRVHQIGRKLSKVQRENRASLHQTLKNGIRFHTLPIKEGAVEDELSEDGLANGVQDLVVGKNVVEEIVERREGKRSERIDSRREIQVQSALL